MPRYTHVDCLVSYQQKLSVMQELCSTLYGPFCFTLLGEPIVLFPNHFNIQTLIQGCAHCTFLSLTIRKHLGSVLIFSRLSCEFCLTSGSTSNILSTNLHCLLTNKKYQLHCASHLYSRRKIEVKCVTNDTDDIMYRRGP
jgi:hypothetical protein